MLGPTTLVAVALALSPVREAPGPRPRAALPTSVWLALAGVAGGLALWRARRGASHRRGPHLSVVAQAPLGGKARAVWLRVDDRELLLAVSPGNVAVLERWRTSATEQATDEQATDEQAADEHAADEHAACRATSAPRATCAPAPLRSHLLPPAAATTARRWRRLR